MSASFPRLRMVTSPDRSHLRQMVRVFAVLLCVAIALTSLGCHHDPYYPPDTSVVDPPIAFDAHGNLVTAYQINDGYGPVTYLQKLTPDGQRLWGEQGVRLDEHQPSGRYSLTWLVTDREHRVTAVWVHGSEILAARLDESGHAVWSVQVPQTESSWGGLTALANAAGTTIIWMNANDDLCLQTVDGDGHFLWPESSGITGADLFAATLDESGNTWVAWVDGYTEAVQVQVFDQSGQPLWAEANTLKEGLEEPYDRLANTGYALGILPNESGGAVVFWNQDAGRIPLTLRSLDATGKLLWSATNPSSYSHYGERLSRTVAGDGKGGILCSWWEAGFLRLQHIDSQGQSLWGDGGLSIAAVEKGVEYGLDYALGADNAGGLFVAWRYPTDRTYEHRAQHVDSGESVLWAGGGIEIGTFEDGFVFTSDDAVFFSSGLNLGGGSHIQKLDMSGNVLWGPFGIRLDDWRQSEAATTDR